MTVPSTGETGAILDMERLLPAQSRAKTVQDHIDELPMWADGTLLSAPPMTRMLCTSFRLVVICLFGVGLSLGSAYPTASMVMAENIPTAHRGRLVLAAYAFQAVGALAGTAVGYLVLAALPTIQAWRWMYAAAIIPAVLVAIGRLYVVESANWLSSQGEIDKAERAARRLLVRQPQYPTKIEIIPRDTQATDAHAKQSYAALFTKANRRATTLASVPWLLQDLGSYGIGIFTPTILVAVAGGLRTTPAASQI